MLRLLNDIMSIPSVNGRDDEGKVAEYICDYFISNGITAKVQRIDELHANVIACLEGDDPNDIMVWNGHLDTVPYGSVDDWNTDPAVPVIDQFENKLYGSGASDMKSGLCAMVYALCEHKKSGRVTPHSILFIGTCDEEKGGIGAEAICKEGIMGKCRKILIGEPTGLKLGMAQKGCIWLQLSAHGKTSHGAYPEQGCNAVEYLWLIAHQLKNWIESFEHGLLGFSTANVTKIQGGTASNMIPETCSLLLDIRVVPGVTLDMICDKANALIKQQVEKLNNNLSVELEVLNHRRSIEIKNDAELVKKMKACLNKSGIEVESIGINYFTDASILVKDQTDAEVLLFGPGEPSMAHKPNESVSLEKYEKAVQVLLDVICV